MVENDITGWSGNLSPLMGFSETSSTGNPDCPTCGKRMKSIMYGFPTHMPTEEDDYVLGG